MTDAELAKIITAVVDAIRPEIERAQLLDMQEFLKHQKGHTTAIYHLDAYAKERGYDLEGK